jgi:foldase protein PrsA
MGRVWSFVGLIAGLSGCGQPAPAPLDDVSVAWTRPHPPRREQTSADLVRREAPSALGRPAPDPEEPLMARVGGKPISRRQVIDLLIRSQGAAVLDQLVSLELAEQTAAEAGVTITPADVEAETERALRRLADPLSTVTEGDLDREAAERLLSTLLEQRNLDREVFRIVMRRNALLRAIAFREFDPTEAEIRAEYERAYGQRVRVRHIQLASVADAMRMAERLAAGEDFAELARRYSANQTSAQHGGRLEVFSRRHDEVPYAFREAAFALAPGAVSSAVRAGEWYHLIKLEERIPASAPNFAAVRDELVQLRRERLAEQAMADLYERLFRDGNIRIYDPALRDEFNRAHGGVAR